MPLPAELEALGDEEPRSDVPRPVPPDEVFMLVPGMVVVPPGGDNILLPPEVEPMPTPGVAWPPVAGIPLPPMPVVMPLAPMLLPVDGSKLLPPMPVEDEV